MYQVLKLIQNSFALFILVIIITVSAVATISLTPVPVGTRDASVAGVDTQVVDPVVLSNYQPLQIEDIGPVDPTYFPQLVQHDESNYIYNASFNGASTEVKRKLIRVTNPNTISVPIRVSTELSAPAADIGFIYLAHAGGLDTAYTPQAQDLELTIYIPAGSSVELVADYRFAEAVSVPITATFSIEY